MKSALQYSIQNLTISPGLVLAPMSGVTDSCFRRLIRRENPGAVGLVVTEFISIEALTRQSRRSFEMMRFHEIERPVGVQIFGYDIERMVLAAKMVEDSGADLVDINCGCPVPKVVRRGGGCELMRQPEHLENILRAVRAAVKIPVTLKIRAGWDSENKNAVEIARMAEGAGISAIAVHGRTKSEGYRGFADWRIIEQVKNAVGLPVIGSGDVVGVETARERVQSGVDGLMIGRAALFHPWVFSEIHAAFSGSEFVPPSDFETSRVIADYAALLSEELPEKAVIGRLKQFASQVTRRVRGSAETRRTLCRSKSVAEFLERVGEWGLGLSTLPGQSNSHDEWNTSDAVQTAGHGLSSAL